VERPHFLPQGYQVQGRLGSGQTSVVWLAVQATAGNRRVALKLPREGVQTDPVLRRMFENEVQITLRLDHPNVVRAYAGAPTGVGAYLALEYCGGGTLDQLLQERGRLPLPRALRLVEDVALGLQHTHAAHVLHRDVKPANVFLDDEGRAKLGDFGTGTFAADQTSERVGTAFYMAPEIFEGGAPTVRSDVYSLAVLAYEVLGGQRPFQGATYDALMVAHLSSLPRPLRQLRPDLPQGVGTIVMGAMSRDPSRRYGSVAAFVDAFAVATGRPPAATQAAPAAPPPAGRGGRSTTRSASDMPPEARRKGGGLFGWFRKRKP
jgi:eukaryotic-like serine/threonine-protein kinase